MLRVACRALSLLLLACSALCSGPYRTIAFSSLCETYSGLGGDLTLGYVSLDAGPLVLTLAPGDRLPSATCALSVFAPAGQGVAVHVAALVLPSRVSSGRCTSWLRLESEYERTEGGWVRVRSFSERICGLIQPRKSFHDGEGWRPGHQFYNETSTNQLTIQFTAGTFGRSSSSFELVVTPLLLGCHGAEAGQRGFDGEQFLCGSPGEAGAYCVDSGLVCDGRVNCMLPGREARDESSVFCRKLGGRSGGREGGAGTWSGQAGGAGISITIFSFYWRVLHYDMVHSLCYD
jgi:hypothetical protein